MENQKIQRLEILKKRRSWKTVRCAAIYMMAFLPLFLCIGGGNLEAQAARKHAAVLADFSAAVQELCDSVSPAVVQIEVRLRAPIENDEGRRTGFVSNQRASGSGVIVDAAGYIITNAHVVEASREIDVSVADSSDPDRRDAHKHYNARVIGTDKETDLAVLKIEAEHLPTLSFRDSDQLKQGEIVFALGSPLGLENTLTVGYISASSRQLKADQSMGYIQTDAPINPGNSGGPLLDIDGKIAGINTMIISQSGGSEGIGFAIPSNIAQRVYGQLRKEGHIHRGTIGVVAQDINPVMSQGLGLNRHPGVILSDVLPHSSAAAAGLEPGDVVLAIDGRNVTEARQVQGAMLQRAIGDNLTLDIQRNGEKMRKSVAIVERPNSPLALADLVSSQANLVKELGILALTLDEKVTPSLGETRRLDGVVVAAIPAEYAALNPGLKAGDLIYSLNKTKIASLDDLRAALSSLKPGDPMVLLVESDGTLGYVSLKLE
jgi:serine protease Do